MNVCDHYLLDGMLIVEAGGGAVLIQANDSNLKITLSG